MIFFVGLCAAYVNPYLGLAVWAVFGTLQWLSDRDWEDGPAWLGGGRVDDDGVFWKD